jgi:hypothetical protein
MVDPHPFQPYSNTSQQTAILAVDEDDDPEKICLSI